MNKTNLFKLIIRTRDILISSLGLLFLSPFFVYIAIQIKRDSSGPVFFKGARVGKDGKLFHILKFRTMHENPDSYNGPKITVENDPRITQVGSWLRDTKINEFPQLWNVLIGEMSLVGPRPEDPDIVADWPEELRNEILSIRPGITSPASVLFRDEETMLAFGSLMETYLGSIQPTKLRLDQLYVRYHSFWVDIDILFWTLLVLFPGLSTTKPPERLLYQGIFSRSARYISNWFIVDFSVALVAVSSSALFLRLLGPIHVGFWAGVVEAIEFAIVYTIIGSLFGIQKIYWSKASPSDVLELFVSSFVATLVLLVMNVFRHQLPPVLIISGSIITFIGLVMTRYRYRVFTGLASRWLKFRKGGNLYRERILIIGSGDAGCYAAWLLTNSKESMKFHIVGYLDDDYQKQGIRFRGAEVLGSTMDVEKITKEYDVGIILYAIHKIDKKKRHEILERCEATQAQVVIFPDIIRQLSETMSNNGNTPGKNANEVYLESDRSKENIREIVSSFSIPQKNKIQAVLEEAKTNLKNSDSTSFYKNILLLNELITDIKKEDIHE